MPSRFGVANPRGNTRGQHVFAQIPSANIERSVFNRSCGVKTGFNSGYLVPILADEALPGDTFHLRTSGFVRMSTPLYPVMDNLYLDLFYFAVPLRLLWSNSKKFNGEQTNPGDPPFTTQTPVFSSFTPTTNSLSDYLGIPARGVAYSNIVSFWHRAYNLIYNEWFRDENLVNSVTVDLGDGPDNIANYFLLRRWKRHDYFSSCLPFTQKGTAVTLPLGTSAPINITNPIPITPIGDGTAPTWQGGTNPFSINVAAAGASPPLLGTGTPGIIAAAQWSNPHLTDTITQAELTAAGMVANLSTATAATINALRQSFQIQKLLERDARGGTRYTEIIRSHFGVVSPDQRLQRPEYLGGGSSRINVHPVADTANVTLGGALYGFATGGIQNGFVRSFTEHCVIIGLANVRADLTYQQGINRMFSRRTRYDFYWPSFAHLGEQAVLNQEIFANNDANDALVFGYQERYAEYRYKPSIVTGIMNSSAASSLDVWHLGLKFTSVPTLNDVFIADQPPMSRILAVGSKALGVDFIGDFWHEYRCARPMPTFSVPGLIDHF